MASWRDVLPIHPAANLFPRMSPDELRALGKDIKKNGLTSPIALWSDGKSPAALLDGISRLDAIEIAISSRAIVGAPSIIAGEDFLACNKVIVLDKSVDPVAYVMSANIHRRHLSAEQKRELIAKLLNADPSRSDRQIGEMIKADHKTVSAVRAQQEATGEISPVEKRVGADGKSRRQPAKKTTTKRGRTVKFTPKRIQQINNLVERGKSREEIAEAIGVTVGSLQVTCSRLGISLRKPLPAEDAASRNDVGPNIAGECERLRALNEELQNENRRLKLGNLALQSEIEELKARLATAPPPADDGLDLSQSLRRAAP